MRQHTPGPWRVGDAGATVFGPKSDKPVPEIVATVRHKANARLIAAAPEMLELLKCYIGAHKSMTPQTLERYDAEARALLAKMRGEA